MIVTIGGVSIGLAILGRFLTLWWPGRKALTGKHAVNQLGRLLPFLLGWCYGVLATLTLGGIVGWAFDTAVWAANWLGDAALVWGVGGEWGQAVQSGQYLPLTGPGHGLMLVLTVCLMAAMQRNPDIAAGAGCGALLGTSAGIAGFAAVPLAQGVNVSAQAIFGAIA
ncbi:hypothetical protein [Streptomyces sp. NPDC101115]|uniref:hypothetical protein n=1 Tax=Streptomyces sp. NPDC101115 TaxID=3366106 RepID=UPI0038210388